MNKKELIHTIAKQANIKISEAEKVFNTFINTVTKTLVEGNKLTLIGFGSFQTNKRLARKGRNPKTGNVIKIPATRIVKFKPGKKLKNAVN